MNTVISWILVLELELSKNLQPQKKGFWASRPASRPAPSPGRSPSFPRTWTGGSALPAWCPLWRAPLATLSWWVSGWVSVRPFGWVGREEGKGKEERREVEMLVLGKNCQNAFSRSYLYGWCQKGRKGFCSWCKLTSVLSYSWHGKKHIPEEGLVIK